MRPAHAVLHALDFQEVSKQVRTDMLDSVLHWTGVRDTYLASTGNSLPPSDRVERFRRTTQQVVNSAPATDVNNAGADAFADVMEDENPQFPNLTVQPQPGQENFTNAQPSLVR
jgi:hypothetical protein